MNPQLDTAIDLYTTALDSLEQTETEIEVDRILQILNARDAIQIAIETIVHPNATILKKNESLYIKSWISTERDPSKIHPEL